MQGSGKTAANVIQPSEISSLVFLGECTRRMVGSYGSGLSIVVINSLAQTILASQWVESLDYPWLGSIVIVTVLGGVIPSASNEVRKFGQTLWDRVQTKIERKCGGLWNKIQKIQRQKNKSNPSANHASATSSPTSSNRARTSSTYSYRPSNNTCNNGQYVFRDAYQPFSRSRAPSFPSYSYSEYTPTDNLQSSSRKSSPIITVVDEPESDDDEVVIEDEGSEDVLGQPTVFSNPALPFQKQE